MPQLPPISFSAESYVLDAKTSIPVMLNWKERWFHTGDRRHWKTLQFITSILYTQHFFIRSLDFTPRTSRTIALYCLHTEETCVTTNSMPVWRGKCLFSWLDVIRVGASSWNELGNSSKPNAAHRRRMVEPRAKHCFASVSPCFGRRNFDKTAHRAVLSLFPLDPEPSKNRFSDTLQPFPSLFARWKMLLCALFSVVSVCSGSFCGQICGRDYGAAVGMQ